MPMQVAVVFVQAGRFDEAFAHSAITYCRARGNHPGYVVHGDWRAVDLLLRQRLAQTVVVGRTVYPRVPAGEPEVDVFIPGSRAATRSLSEVAASIGRPGTRQRGVAVLTKLAEPVGLDSPEVQAGNPTGEITAYRSGYADGYVDCLTIGGQTPD